MNRLFYKILPILVGTVLSGAFIIIYWKYGLSFYNLKGFENVLESVVNFVSIVIGFYSAFYGMIIAMSKSAFMKELQQSKYRKDLPEILLYSLLSAFSTLVVTLVMQILINYDTSFALIIYFIWFLLVGIFITYALQTSILSIAMIFGSNPVAKGKSQL
ncbi:hypothetical protein [Lactiplantibacillus plantarum]|uniref:hypothetical protein n=1 Tax=Lactiplantibacillus plantarum TaxID=1590 RepID=UPI000938730A|nr:hypothetical protein [Lactiplantibacillus plantarum]APP10922.1 hypothetical protein BSG92_00060 [Lactiplantibacillus plantarum subsp. plantarum]MCG0728928.1 hypothetical protein [Lactiplantibacillus plantarum]MCG0744316.1 hypothetical protein [Lactiplantibacillus plantarum]MCG0885044.1 hypothetical protein [Lactiplantibacillus plantarum]MCG0885055.1 hypothetical protein [Lactiplantibacillus plantarum]